ncbi:Nitrogen permease regulator 3 [Emydomyces testavorans]|uniref:Nitrogen permease regulator 3 n=1 Tax=Emydomyces testavorans TaxID=2070801 RepID=A0AAF0DRD7_9EURO|nr:Nitrogen permease regulator 3 [Emydomyces testavorans]
MSSFIRPPDPCLVAIILIICSRAGPRFVYHYPPNPSVTGPSSRRNSRPKSIPRTSDSSASSDNEDGSSSDEDEPSHARAASAAGSTDGNLHSLSPGSQTTRSSSQHKRNHLGSLELDGSETMRDERRSDNPEELENPQWDSFLGLGTDVWEKLLCPSHSWNKRRFEVGVNDLTFVGWPVFERAGGSWRKKRKKKKARVGNGGKDTVGEGLPCECTGDAEKSEVACCLDNQDGLDKEEEPSRSSMESYPEDDESVAGGSKDSMTMFNVVFVMNPPILEHNLRIKENYDNVIKKFGRGLKSEQATANYVWKQAQTILHIREKARENRLSLSSLYDELLSSSSLARAIATIYQSISTSKIASVTLTPHTTMSLQIPPLTSTPYLPGPTEPAYPGLWLTTADSLSATDEATDMGYSGPSKVLAKHFALLLLSDEASILKDIETSMGTLGPPLAHYIRSSRPTKSFAQISARSSIPLSDIQVLASHLIYWRRARAVPPLNKQDTYIVSPNCDMSKLALGTAAYEAAFPTLPSLPKMLAVLSGTPRPYSSFIPSRDHKGIYYDILAWLMRGGWVTQLRTFGWIKVDPEIKKAVEKALAREEAEENEEDLASSTTTIIRAKEPEIRDNASSSSSSLDSDNSGTIPAPGRFSHFQGRHHKGRSPPQTSSLILRPHRASPLEARWLDEIISQFPDDCFPERTNDTEDSESELSLHRYWNAFTKYFNGTDALEKIPVREGLNRKLVWKLLTRIDASASMAGGEVNPREKVLVTVRHW